MSLEGGCLCGAVRYRIEEDSPPCYACHCTECQTHSGSAFVLQMPVFANKFIIEGKVVTADQDLPNGRVSTIHCCATCLVRLFAKVTGREGLVTVRAGTLDNSKTLTPVAHIWVRSKQEWLEIPDGHRVFEKMPSEADWFEILDTKNRLEAG
ncbi:GFA family protein [Parasphingopyxis sp. CP4]|uniref:GFA family protein n=1 Tax=Parasphingopyxis sp. CP4 TaxID=2724527 RepID=UPI0015A3B09B|nr:GFA family protein [Parasphingopyxis sp. CP4]QLC21583.1 GFA family protein [Parasphingopyxis sp. CP4]